MRMIILKPSGVGPYGDVSPFMIVYSKPHAKRGVYYIQ